MESQQRISTMDRRVDTGPARLVVIGGNQTGRKYTIDSQASIGRATDALVNLDDPEVSRNHARITRDALGAYLLEDLGSKNGTLVNGTPIRRHVLAFGDKLQVGPNVALLFAPFDPVEDLLLQRQRLEALGRVGAGVAHDLNNMLGAIAASLDFLGKLPAGRTLDQSEVRECVDDIRAATTHASELARGILHFARGRSNGHSELNLSALCEEVARLVRHTFDRNIELEARIAPDLFVRGDRTELHQVFMNLCLNARDAMPSGGILRIVARRTEPQGVRESPDGVSVSVEDTGSGIDEATQRKIFEPFFSTKSSGSGFGLGLATAKELVEFHGGCIELESVRGRGTRFSVLLPSRQGEQQQTTTDRPAAFNDNAPTKGLVLLVDDEAVVRRALARLLRQAGHEVIEANGGPRALELYAAAARRPDLVVLDLDMPVWSGEQTQQKLLELDPNARILVVSGHDEPQRETAVHIQGALGFLRKPCEGATLLRAVAEAMANDDFARVAEELTRPV
jgi:signal transduction histidine kinase/CheY-like chemotaxis protein